MTVGPQLRQAIGYLEMSNAALLAALKRDAVEGASTSLPDVPAETRPSLYRHVADQAGLVLSSARERAIATHFIEALEPSGWLGEQVTRIVARAGVSEREAEAVHAKLRQIEPTGLFATSLADCLGLQARERDVFSPAMAAVLENLPAIADGGPGALAEAAGLDEVEVGSVLQMIRGFDPKPGAAFDGARPDRRRPFDLELTADVDGVTVAFNPGALPEVKVAPGAGLRAQRLARMVEERNALVLKVAGAAARHQAGWIVGAEPSLRPLRRADISVEAGVHVSTVSRIAAAVTLRTPRGTLRLAHLFAKRAGDGPLSIDTVAARIARIVEAENLAAPLSDREIGARLAADGLTIPRRSLSRYRTRAGIPPAHKRRKPV